MVANRDHAQDPANDHIPDLATFDGLVDLISICTLGKLLSVVDLRTYGDEKMIPQERNLWQQNDATPLPLADRLANQYARGQCMELLTWANDHFVVVDNSDGAEAEQDILTFERQLFKKIIHILFCYKQSADANDIMHGPNFTSANLKMQLIGLCKTYGMDGLEKEMAELLISEMNRPDRSLFAFPDGMTVKEKQKGHGDASLSTNNSSKVKQLINLGRTNRDTLHEAYSVSIKAEKTAGM